MAKTKKTSAGKLTLAVTKREVFGKKLSALRKQGFIPANIFGPGFTSQSISTPFKEFIHTYRIAQETGVIYLTGLKDELPVLIKQVQRHPVTDAILHVDFRKIDLSKNVETEVPIVFVNQSEAVSQKGGVLLQQMKVLKVEALPQNIPHEIAVDISVIKEVGEEIKVSDLPPSSTYTVKDDPSLVIVSVVAHKEESVTPEITAAAAPEVITAAPAEEAAEGAVGPAEAQPAKSEGAPATQKTPAKGEEKK